MMLYSIRRIQHYLTANSRHGTHSPFVYALADELIYNKEWKRGESLMQDIQDYYACKGFDAKSFVMVDLLAHSANDILRLQNEYFMVFVRNIYHSKAYRQWKLMQENENFIVLIDLFEFGIVCKRKEQPKENFKLRYPYRYY